MRPVIRAEKNEPTLEFLAKYKDADTELTVVNIDKGPVSIECTYDNMWAELFTVQECEKSDKEGYDGVLIHCFADSGLRAAKEALNIPVVGINEAAVHMASTLGDKFSIISVKPDLSEMSMFRDLLRLYGVESRCASIRSITIPVLELEKDKEETTARVLDEARKAVEEDGADTIVMGCGRLIDIDVEEPVCRDLKVPVVVPAIAGLKMCEALIEMGIAQSKRFFAPPPAKKRIS